MKSFWNHIISTIVLLFAISVLHSQQVQELMLPYECGFEDSIEVSGWVLNAGANGTKCQEQWMIGNLEYHGGRQSLYLSRDTGKTTYFGNKPNVVIAYKKVRIPDLTADTKCGIDISFDWKCMGEVGKIGLHFYFVPVNRVRPNDLNSLHNTGSLTSGLSRSDVTLTASYDWTTWTSPKDKYIIPEEAEYYLIFVWQNSNLDANRRQPFAACIDNLQLSLATAPRPTDLNATSSNDTISISWSGNALNYEVQYRLSGKKWLALATMPAAVRQKNSCMLTDLDEGLYEIRVRGRNSNDPKDCSCWVVIKAICYIPENHCIDFVNLDREGVYCYRGVCVPKTELNLTGLGNTGCGPVSFGETAMSSRHQVNWTQDQYDPRTDNGLRTIPSGGLASVRLGNWDIFGEAESIEFEYLVDTLDAKIILLKYAVVLEAPGHGLEEDPYFKLEILDENNRVLDSKCGDFDFSPENKSINWITSGAYVWKDWTSIGMNIEQYHGQLIKIRLLTQDCKRSGHAGYAYFTLDCLDASIKSTSCGDAVSIEMQAPEGFEYIWTKRSEPDKVISTRQVLHVAPDDTATYDCQVEYVGIEGCGFNLFTSIVPRFPYPDFEWKWIPSNCENKIALINKSYVRTKVAGEFTESSEKLEYSFWTVEDENWYSTKMDTAIYIVSNDGDTINMVLEVGLAGGTCSEDTVIQIIVPPIYGTRDTIYQELCAGKHIVFNKEFIAKSGVYIEVLSNRWGCDSVTVLDLTVLPEIEDTYIEETICSNESFKFWDETYSESGTYKKLLYSKKGCDSIVILNLNVITPMGIIISNPEQEVCADQEVLNFEFDFIDTLRHPASCSVVFDSLALACGFVNKSDIAIDEVNKFLSVVLPDSCRPNRYTAKFIFSDTTSICGDIEIPIEFDVYYSSSILQPKFNNLIALLDKETNGGYEFITYQWYKNGELMEGEIDPYLYLPEGETFADGDCYHLLLKRKDDGVVLKTCAVCPATTPIDDVEASDIAISATLLNKGQSILIQNFDKGLVNIYSFTGQLIDSYKITSEMTEIFAPNQQGFYLLELITTKDHSVYKIYVKDN